MIQLVRPALSVNAARSLQQYQTAVDGQPDFPAQVSFAKSDFPAKNVIGNATFDEVKLRLLDMSSGAERCHYCEDSKADEVEHLLPKDVYPNHCYNWNNYYYSCGNCNGPKNNKCAVINAATNTLIDITPPKKLRNAEPVAPPPPIQGIIAIIDPIADNPLDYLFLNITEGFTFSEKPDANTIEFLKAKYTVKILRLNRSFLLTARAKAYENFRARLKEYCIDKNKGIAKPQLDAMKAGIKQEAHQTVWQEMKRQRNFIPELQVLFDQVPEALEW